MNEKIKAIIALLTGNIIKDIGEAFDRNFTSKEEKLQALNELEKTYNERLKIIAEVRDPDNDSWWSKNIRPICLLLTLTTLSVILIFNIETDSALIKLYSGWTGTMVTLYFGVREAVKFIKRKKK